MTENNPEKDTWTSMELDEWDFHKMKVMRRILQKKEVVDEDTGSPNGVR